MLRARSVDPAFSSTIDAGAQRVIEQLSAVPASPGLSPIAARQAYRDTRRPLTWPLEPVAAIEDLAGAPDLPSLRLFRPASRRDNPDLSLIFLHGGGWTVGDLDVYEPLCRRLANVLSANIFWVEYRLAPEHPFPAALEDTLAACRWIFANAGLLGIDAARIGIAGDSAGGNLAAVAALVNRRAELGRRFLCQLLIYPCLDLTATLPSHRNLARGYLLTAELYAWYRSNYLGSAYAGDWRASPLFAGDIRELAPAVLLHAGFDPLRDEALAYLSRLRGAGVAAAEISYPGMIHGFLNMGAVLPQAGEALERIRNALRFLIWNDGRHLRAARYAY